MTANIVKTYIRAAATFNNVPITHKNADVLKPSFQSSTIHFAENITPNISNMTKKLLKNTVLVIVAKRTHTILTIPNMTVPFHDGVGSL